ncbi:hypothetical protein [Escherichia phage dw-ec]|nr:hypothetical protein [Escherichia phage BI-EHEC]UJQ43807.1 hypothetical protein [Escherichia phage dw-ec]
MNNKCNKLFIFFIWIRVNHQTRDSITCCFAL